VRDPRLNEVLRQLAAEAATRFSTLVAGGEQIPFDVTERAGPDSLFHSYLPLTARFVREHEGELRSLSTFAPACGAVEAAGVAAAYLEQHGEQVPAAARERSARMLTVFIASLWDGCTEFSLDRERLDNALAVLDAEVRDVDDAEVLVAPVVGLRMPLARLQLPHGVELVRADAIEAPIDAVRSEGMGRSAWEPQFLAVAELDEGAGSSAAALRQLRELISVMRLFKAGGIGLGPYAFGPTGEGRWRRVATGAAATRPGGYVLSEDEATELSLLASTLEARPDPAGTLAWAVARFEMGCERATPVQGLSDHLLALRSLLEGQGPVGASLPMRAAALIAADSGERPTVRLRIEHALELERAAMSGTPALNGIGPEDAVELARWIEGSVRGVLRAAALGELGTDLGVAADETLIASGLSEGDFEIAVAHEPEAELESQEAEPESRRAEPRIQRAAPDYVEPELEYQPRLNPHADLPSEEDEMDEDTRILEPVPGEDEIRITATNWLEEVEVEEDAGTIEWPAGGSDVERRERVDTPRVRHLFPVPEDADWEVRELDYDHYRRAG
jgi:hypothetical protein